VAAEVSSKPEFSLTMDWSDWYPLFQAGRNQSFPKQPGIYRIRRIGGECIDYIGQTGQLRPRLGMLSGVYKPVMPYNDPHTAGPAFWALKQQKNCDYQASTAIVSSQSTPHRKGVECVAIAQHRQAYGKSPSFNFGRMPLGYSKSSSNNRSLVERGLRHRGEKTSEELKCHIPGIEPRCSLDQMLERGGHSAFDWSTWQSAETALANISKSDIGLYILRRKATDELVYVGEGKIRDRVSAHLKKGHQKDHPQAFAFADPSTIELSFTLLPEFAKHQLLEIENDLIAAHLLQHGEVPAAQFIG
jgi:hypothetical protein